MVYSTAGIQQPRQDRCKVSPVSLPFLRSRTIFLKEQRDVGRQC